MKQPPRFIVSDLAALDINGTVRVTGSELHHLRDVMRLSIGEEVVLIGSEIEYRGYIDGFESNAAIVSIASVTHGRRLQSLRLIVAAGMIKAPRMDLLIEKAAELDTDELWPLLCARSVVRQQGLGRRQRWQRIGLAAAKQALRSSAMLIHDPVDLDGMVRSIPKSSLAVMCAAGAEPLSALIRHQANHLNDGAAVVLAIGPEGDFTSEEMGLLKQAGFVAAGLGKNRLRTETATTAAVSITRGILAELNHDARTLRLGKIE
jgi:16S rRNA (uracil1498-N3)-methyltransferase